MRGKAKKQRRGLEKETLEKIRKQRMQMPENILSFAKKLPAFSDKTFKVFTKKAGSFFIDKKN